MNRDKSRDISRAALFFWSALLAPAVFADEPILNGDGLLLAEPPKAAPGECWAQLVQPATYERHSESVVKTPAGERMQKIPARYDWVDKTTTIPAGKRRVVTKPAEYEVTEEQVLITPAGSHERITPAQYKTVEERVVSKTGTVLKPNAETGEMCAVEGPVEYQLVKRQVLVTPAGSEKVDQPARYKTVKQKKLIHPAEYKLVDAPERTVTHRVRELVEPAHEVPVPTPAVYEDQVKVVETAPAHNRWVRVVCDVNTTPALLRSVQQALAKQGFNPGRTDGHWDSQSGQALRRYQEKAGLLQGGLTIETVQSLGVSS